MKKNDIRNDYAILNGNTVRLEAPGTSGRVHMEGSGKIHAYVAENAVDYKEVSHLVAFENGVAEFPIQAFIGDHLQFTAGTITAFEINWIIEDRR